MGSSPTLAQAASGHDPTDPAVRAAEDAYGRLNPYMAFAWPNPYRPGIGPADLPRVTRPDGPQTRRDLVRVFEDISARGYQVVLDETNESPPTPPLFRLAHLRYRATRAQELAAERHRYARADAEAAFDRLNPDYGERVAASDSTQQARVRHHEDRAARGVRVLRAERVENALPRPWRQRAVAARAALARERASQPPAER